MPATDDRESKEPNMYDVLGISSTATSTEVRRAYRNLITKARLPSGGRLTPSTSNFFCSHFHPSHAQKSRHFELIFNCFRKMRDKNTSPEEPNTGVKCPPHLTFSSLSLPSSFLLTATP